MTDTELLNWLEEQAKQGACIGLVHDDNGHWAVSSSGVQNCLGGPDPEDVDTTFFVFKGEWRDSIREAIEYAFLMEGQ